MLMQVVEMASPWLALAVFVAYDVSTDRPNYVEKQVGKADYRQRNADEGQYGNVATPAPDCGWQPEEREHRRKEKIYWGMSLILGTVSLAGAGAAVLIARGAFITAQRQLSVMETDQRAWIAITDVKVPGALAYVAVPKSTGIGNWQLSISYNIQNIGKSPAFEVTSSANIKPYLITRHPYYHVDTGKGDPIDNTDIELRRHCSGLESLMFARPFQNDLLFPGAAPSPSRWDGNTWTTFNPDEQSWEGIFLVLVCVAYKIVDDHKVHHTGMAYIWRPTGGTPLQKSYEHNFIFPAESFVLEDAVNNPNFAD